MKPLGVGWGEPSPVAGDFPGRSDVLGERVCVSGGVVDAAELPFAVLNKPGGEVPTINDLHGKRRCIRHQHRSVVNRGAGKPHRPVPCAAEDVSRAPDESHAGDHAAISTQYLEDGFLARGLRLTVRLHGLHDFGLERRQQRGILVLSQRAVVRIGTHRGHEQLVVSRPQVPHGTLHLTRLAGHVQNRVPVHGGHGLKTVVVIPVRLDMRCTVRNGS